MDREQQDEEIAHLEAIAEYYRRQLNKIQELIDRVKKHTDGFDKPSPQ